MKKRMLYKLSWGILLAGLTACSDLTDSYKEYLDWGERVYAGKMDSVGVRPGRLRQQLDFFYTSPRLSRGVIYWNQKQDSLEFDLPWQRGSMGISFIPMTNTGILPDR